MKKFKLNTKNVTNVFGSGVLAPLRADGKVMNQYTSNFGEEMASAALGVVAEYFTESSSGLVVGDADSGERLDVVFHPSDTPSKDRFGFIDLFRSLSHRERLSGDFCYPAFPHSLRGLDWAGNSLCYLVKPLPDEVVVSFTGVTSRPAHRKASIDALRSLPVKTVIVERSEFAHAERDDYVSLIEQSSFVWCPDGVGSWSYRTFEALSLGRMPILTDRGQCLPYGVGWLDVSARHDKPLPQDYPHEWLRKVWLNRLSPVGWLETFHRILYENQ